MAITILKDLCPPAFVYLVLSLFVMVFMILQNIGNFNTYCLGELSCHVSSTPLIFVIKFLYIVFWTWILDIICKSGSENISWFLVLFPFILFFVLIALLILNRK